MSYKQNGNAPFDRIQYHPIDTVIQIETIARSCSLNTLKEVLKSAIPYLMFLALYGLNSKLHILPTATDVDAVDLYNIGAFEYWILHFHPHKIISSHSHIILDFLAAVPYLMHYILPVVFPLYLLIKGKQENISKFYWLLGWFLWLQYLIWYFLPTAPPWFYDNMNEYSANNFVPPLKDQHKEGCAFRRVDNTTGSAFFFKMFGSNPVPYGAFPSGHVAWPTAICVVNPPLGGFCWFYVMYVAWATLYSCHHYLSDALAAVAFIFLVRRLLIFIKEKQFKNNMINRFKTIICPFNIQ